MQRQILGQHRKVIIDGIQGPGTDAFGRLRTSQPHTIFDTKLTHTAEPELWDEQEVSGSGTTTSHNPNRASVIMGVSNLTAGKRVRQTFSRPNYQPAKSQLIMMTGILGDGQTGITREIGNFDDENGVFFRNKDGVIYVGIKSFVTGTAVDNVAPQTSWNVDRMDGNGPSGHVADWTKTQIFIIDFEWLGVGRVRFAIDLDGIICVVHEFTHANIEDKVYMSTPNNPLRLSIENDGTGGAATIECICVSVMSEGGQQGSGIDYWYSTGGTHVDCNAANSIYALVGAKLQEGHKGEPVQMDKVSLITQTNDDFEWMVIRNPTVSGDFIYSCVVTGPFMVAKGTTANVVTAGEPVTGGFVSKGAIAESVVNYEGPFGEAIDGTRDEFVLCARPLTSNADIEGGIQLHVEH